MTRGPCAVMDAAELEAATGPARVRLQGDRFAFLLAYHPEGFPSGLEAVADAVRAYARQSGQVMDFLHAASALQAHIKQRATVRA